MTHSFFPVCAGDSVLTWQLSTITETPFTGRPASLDDAVNNRFVNGFIDVGELPCRVAWRQTMLGRAVSLPKDFEVDCLHLPGLSQRIEFTGFWHTPHHLARWCQTRLRAPQDGNYPFLLATCGGVRIWVDGVAITSFEPFTRNTEQHYLIELPLRASGSDIVVLCEELAERDTLWYFELRNSSRSELLTELPPNLLSADFEALRQIAQGVHAERDFFSEQLPFTLAFDPIVTREIVVEVSVRRFSSHPNLSPLLQRKLQVPIGASRLPVAAPAEIEDGLHLINLRFTLNGKRVERRINAAFLAKINSTSAANDLNERKREALQHLAQQGESRIGKALAMLETRPYAGHDANEIKRLIASTLDSINRREDCSDFVMLPLLWLYAAHRERLPANLAHEIQEAVIHWRYWMDEPGNDSMWFWSENHALCFHTAQWLAGYLLPNEHFQAAGRTGSEQAQLGLQRLTRWFDAVEAHGLAEWNSAAYYPIDFIGLLTLQQWAEPALAARAHKVLDRIFSLVALHTTGGIPAGSMGRAYDKDLKAGPLTELAPFCRVAFGHGWLNSGVAALPLFAASHYQAPAHTQHLAQLGEHVTLEACCIQGYEPALLTLYKKNAVQLSSVQISELGRLGHQQHVIDLQFSAHPFARAWINHPGEDDPFGQQRPSYWAGNRCLPLVGQIGDTALMIYALDDSSAHSAARPFTHAYVASDAFDEIIVEGQWIFLRSGDGYAALGGHSQIEPVNQGASAGREYRLFGARSAWVVRISSGQGHADFAMFCQAMTKLSTHFDAEQLRWQVRVPGQASLTLDSATGLTSTDEAAFFPAATVVPQICLTFNLERAQELVAAGFARLKAINETSAAAAGHYDIQFDEWDWEVGVGLYGLVQQAVSTQNTELFSALERWYDWQIGRGLPPRQVNSTAPMLPLVLLIEHIERPDWAILVQEWAEWLITELPRTEDGGFQHVVKERPNTGELWDDTLFMTCLFLARAGQCFKKQNWVDEATNQFLVHARYLADPKTGLWYHGWTFNGRHNFANAFWARGNSWITAAIPELFHLLGGAAAISQAAQRALTAMLSAQVSALRDLQRPDGLFHTLLNDPSSPVETSATAGIAYGILRATQMGLLPDSCQSMAWRGLSAVLKQIDPDGIVGGVSDGTAMGHSLDFYRQIANVPAPYGQALVMLLLGEAIRQHEQPTQFKVNEALT